MNSRTIERLHSKLMALYDEREEYYLDIEEAEAMGEATLQIEQQLSELNSTIKEIERQIHEEESNHLEYMKEAI